MNRRYADMQTNVGNNVQDTSSTTQTIIKRMINDAYFDILRRFNWEFFNYDYELTTTGGTQDYELPRDFGRELYVVDSTNNNEVTHISLQRLAREYPETFDTDEGEVERYTILKRRVVSQPSSASVITFVSDDNSDTTQTAFVRGIVDGVEQTESVTLNGTTNQATSNSFSRILSISFSAVRAGKVTITSNSGAVTIGTVAPEVLDYSVKVVRFHFIPTDAVTIKMPYKIDPLPLNNDNDVPLISADVVEQLATAHVWRYKRQMAKAQEWERVAEKAIINTIWNQENSVNQTPRFDVVAYSRETV